MSRRIVGKEVLNENLAFDGTSLRSVWGKPNRSIYRFLRILEETDLPKTIAILGCSDGKFVLPAARKGFSVLAIDIDRVALYGGNMDIFGSVVPNIGMITRLKNENLLQKVEVVNQSFLEYILDQKYTGVFTSGSIHYGENSRYTLPEVVSKIQDYVTPQGLLFQEYIHTSDADNDPERHFVDKQTMNSFFGDPQWTILRHRKKQYLEGPNPRNDQEHIIVWGSILVRRNH